MATAPDANIPTNFVAFGATGDLMRRKVIPSLYYLHTRGNLPDRFRVVGFSRRDWSHDEFRRYIHEVVEDHTGVPLPEEVIRPFLQLFFFQKGTFEDAESYRALKTFFDQSDKEWGVCSSRLFYLAVAPEFYEGILKNLSDSGLTDPCGPDYAKRMRSIGAKGVGETTVSPFRRAIRSMLRTEGSQGEAVGFDEGWTRVIVEKPFGIDSDTAKTIDELLDKLFKEEQIYRIDHYLAKEMLQNILAFRFANNLFEMQWGNKLIERISIKLYERIGVEKRGPFYDSVGALRDVGQNHLLQMLALVTMEHPLNLDASSVQKKRAEILEQLEVIPAKDAKQRTFRGQYAGYRDIEGVAKDSETETYFKIRASLASKLWKDVPIILESGKRMGDPLKEIIVTFKHPSPCLCPPGGPHHKNEVIIRMEPREEILIEFWTKKPGFTFETEQRMFHYMLRDQSDHVPYVEEYAKLLLDCVRGDQTLFISTDEIRAMWRFTDPILDAWRKGNVPLMMYEPDTKAVAETSNYVENI